MNEILTDKMLHEIFEAISKGESYGYSDGNTSIEVTPNSISVNFRSNPTVQTISTKDRDVAEFLNFCDSIDDDLFVEVCETFTNEELTRLQNGLDTDSYQETIKVFSTRVGEVAHNRLTEICNAADSEIRRQEMIIEAAKKAIDDIHKELDEAHAKYAI